MSQGQRNVLLGGIAIAAIAVAVIIFTRTGPAARPESFAFNGVCLSCQKDVKQVVPLNEYAPFTCPHCATQAVYPWFYCNECNRRFVPDLVRPDPAGPWRIPQGIACRACGSGNVGSWDPDFPTQQPIGDAQLPKWTP